jgi:hypothetical protein
MRDAIVMTLNRELKNELALEVEPTTSIEITIKKSHLRDLILSERVNRLT